MSTSLLSTIRGGWLVLTAVLWLSCGCGCAGASLELAGWRMPDGSLVLLLVNLLDQPRALTLSLPAPAGDGEAIAEAWVIFEQDRRIDVSTRIFY